MRELDAPIMGIAMPICAGYTSLRFRKIEKVATTDVQRIFISSATARSKRLMMLDAPYPLLACGLRFFSHWLPSS
jgi:hypothetical protein